MRVRQRADQSTKLKLSSTMMGWLPVLHSSLEDIEKTLEPFIKEQPHIDVRSNFQTALDKRFFQSKNYIGNSRSDVLESMTVEKESFFSTLKGQIDAPLFPTKRSQYIATTIIEQIDEYGYFDGNYAMIEELYGIGHSEVERIRRRFSHLEPVGVGALNFKESFMFQLDDVEGLSDDLYALCSHMIAEFEAIDGFKDDALFYEALAIIKKFRNPPALDYIEDSRSVIPEIFIDEREGALEVVINDKYYPDIQVNLGKKKIDADEEKMTLKEAKNIIDALSMRKATLKKIGLMIVEYQYDFFKGGPIKPMRLKDLAEEIDRSQSTISRAISNKYLSCNRGVIAIKDFFSTALDEETSNSAIKEFIQEQIKNENRKKPLSDNKLLMLVEEKFKVQMVRRTIAKYRKQLNIAGSSERKKLYIFSV
jgi:RNA polymerase sigma-54 factor